MNIKQNVQLGANFIFLVGQKIIKMINKISKLYQQILNNILPKNSKINSNNAKRK